MSCIHNNKAQCTALFKWDLLFHCDIRQDQTTNTHFCLKKVITKTSLEGLGYSRYPATKKFKLALILIFGEHPYPSQIVAPG